MTKLERTYSTLPSLFDYKEWANNELFAALAEVDAEKYADEANAAVRILNHVYVVDGIFKGHLTGEPHGFKATNTKETPTLPELTAAVKALDAWYVSYVSTLTGSMFVDQVRFSFTDGDEGLMTREEILLHVVTHGGYHRGAAGQIMRDASVVPPRDLYTRFLHESESERRK